jgi:hypothetical protein
MFWVQGSGSGFLWFRAQGLALRGLRSETRVTNN